MDEDVSFGLRCPSFSASEIVNGTLHSGHFYTAISGNRTRRFHPRRRRAGMLNTLNRRIAGHPAATVRSAANTAVIERNCPQQVLASQPAHRNLPSCIAA